MINGRQGQTDSASEVTTLWHYTNLFIIIIIIITCCWVLAKDGKKVREKIRKIASRVEEEDFTQDLDMVRTLLFV